MNTNDVEIISDFIGVDKIPCELGVVAVAKDIVCEGCGIASEFDPRISTGTEWNCICCWLDEDDNMISTNMLEKLEEVKVNTQFNYMMRQLK